MNKKKRILLLLLSGCFIAVISSIHWTPPPPPPPPPQNDFEQNPPLVADVWVQQLQVPINNNNLMIQVKYNELETMPLQVPVYLGQNTITMYDDGTNGDPVPGDSIYTGMINENPQDFANDIIQRLDAVNSQVQQGVPFFTFEGHLGSQLSSQQVNQQLTFNSAAFNSFASVPLSPVIFSPAAAAMSSPCALPAIKKEQSLFITDLSVVEDPARTYNVVTGVGNPVGNWTFGTMINNMTGGVVTPSALLLSWFNNYMNPVVVNTQTINARVNFINFVIAPWEVAAGVAPTRAFVTPANWLALWNTIPAPVLLKNAPFKLTAIVNRLDLRGNSGYSGGVSNAGETRFIFTLIDPNPGDLAGPPPFLGNGGFITGMPPLQVQSDPAPGLNLLDWKGFNVIFEYGNVQNNLCAVVNFANQWVNLSSLVMPSAAYNAALESLTTTVTNLNAAPLKVNGSAINRIRTNERICDNALFGAPITWETSDWEFRQFELQTGTNLFAQVALTNTPLNSANAINNTGVNNDITTAPGVPTIPAVAADQNNLMNWIFSTPANVATILAGNISIPAMWAGAPLLSGGARVDYEYLHYIDLNWSSPDPNYTAYAAANPVPGNATYKKLRQQLSISSCQGCHAGESKTMFTHVLPMGYGVSAKYWVSPVPPPPDFTAGRIDTRFVSKTNVANYPAPPNPENVVRVSAFLTGRNYRQPGGVPGYFDDYVNAAEDLTDPTMNGLFYVNAPDNYPTNAIGLNTYLFGYNDLERRRIDLIMIACTNCTTMKTTPLLQILVGVPQAFGGH